jgi:NADH-quinone oxidoreductase subunit G
VRDHPDSEGWKRALQAADFVVAFAMFEDSSAVLADVVLPVQSHAEKEGTVTHPDGRLQRLRPNVQDPGQVRPGWEVLCELAAALDHETGLESAPELLAAIGEEVGIYSGITAEEIGGRGVRWQERDGGGALPEGTAGRAPLSGGGVAREGGDGEPNGSAARQQTLEGRPIGDGLLLGTYHDIWASPVTELNPPLHFLTPKQRVELAPADAERLALSDGDVVSVSRNGSSVRARVAIRERMNPGACFLIEGTAEENANALLNRAPQVVKVEKLA